MKIDTPFTTSVTFPKSTDKRQDDDYYWQHQTQLQQSALTFHTLIDPRKNPMTNSDHTAPIPEKSPTIVPTPKVTLQVSSTPNRVQIQSTSLAEHEILPLMTDIQRTLNELKIFMLEQGNINKFIMNTKSGELRNTTTVPANALFKNYHVFLNNQEVELSLNTTQLSTPQIIKLHKFIKQWLAQKGYSLKSLRINGVPQ